MSVQYKPVLWDRSKYVYDAVLILAVAAYLAFFLRVAPGFVEWARPVDPAIQRMRAFGSCAFLMLSVILAIGPLARLDPRFLPLLYNRRHFGVLTCAIAAAHAAAVLDWYFAFSPIPQHEALLSSNLSYDRFLGFPFEALGIFALAVLVVMAVTSHDFWMSFLTPPVWKAIHMSVYAAYAAVVAHVALGYLQSNKDPTFAVIVGVCALVVTGLHVAAAWRERAVDAATPAETEGWLAVGAPLDIADGRGKIVVRLDGERIAVFRDGTMLAALTNTCAHQNGPLGEGRVIDGCATCPWHGHQFRLIDGCAPPPFTDKVAIHRLRLRDGLVEVRAEPEGVGVRVEPLIIEEAAA